MATMMSSTNLPSDSNSYLHHQKASQSQAFSLQKYLVLYSTHEALRKQIESFSSSSSSSSSNATHNSSLPTIQEEKVDSLHKKKSRDVEMRIIPLDLSGIRGLEGVVEESCFEGEFESFGDFEEISRLMPSSPSSPISAKESLQIINAKAHLQEVNLQIKNTLMELLNWEEVKGDNRYRKWIQNRLMEVEKELRARRRKRVGRGGV